jgi:hypothetical protein
MALAEENSRQVFVNFDRLPKEEINKRFMMLLKL